MSFILVNVLKYERGAGEIALLLYLLLYTGDCWNSVKGILETKTKKILNSSKGSIASQETVLKT